MAYERANIQQMTGYVPGEQPDRPSVIKLNTNENPYPPIDGVLATLRTLRADSLRRYPNPTARPFRQLAAEIHQLAPGQVIAVNGGDELLRLAVTTFVEPGRPIGYALPSYSLYPVLAAAQGSPVHNVPLGDDWSVPDDLPQRMNDAGVQLTFIVNPHAPSGRLASVDQLAKLADQLDGVLLVDEAYVDFVDPQFGHDATILLRDFDNVLLLRTLSKGYSLAGLRFGYGLGDPSLIEPMLTKTRDSYNTDAVAQALAVAALQNREAAASSWLAVRAERQRLTDDLKALGLDVYPSQANFLLVSVPDNRGGGARAVYESLKRNDILIRYFDQDRLRDKLRITIGRPDENDALIGALQQLLDTTPAA